MVFSSTLFLCMFLPLSLLGYYLIRHSYKNNWFLFVSLIFFAWPRPGYLWVILLSILINYCGALLLDHVGSQRKMILTFVLIADLTLLVCFKYLAFIMDSADLIFGSHLSSHFDLQNIVLPIGISFFTFQGMSYVIDVYRRKTPAQKSPLKMGLYLALFAKLPSGPIVRYKDFEQDLDVSHRKVSQDDFARGIERFIIGLGKKTVIADTMAVMVDAIWENGAAGNSSLTAWAGSIAFTLQIYFDFSGYSDMAIGLGRMFGFHFPENFNLPYVSGSLSEFWRRWHITLSSWFRDYVYIPLGGNKKHVYRNLLIVFLLTGIWHGAGLHFIVWGLWNAAFVLLERRIAVVRSQESETAQMHGSTGVRSQESETARVREHKISRHRECGTTEDGIKKKSIIISPPKIFQALLPKIYTLFVVNLGWVLFRAPSMKEAMEYIGCMFGFISPDRIGYTLFWYLDRWTITIMLVGILFASSVPVRIMKMIRTRVSKNAALSTKAPEPEDAASTTKSNVPESAALIIKYTALLLLLYLSMLRIIPGSYHPFIYFQF